MPSRCAAAWSGRRVRRTVRRRVVRESVRYGFIMRCQRMRTKTSRAHFRTITHTQSLWAIPEVCCKNQRDSLRDTAGAIHDTHERQAHNGGRTESARRKGTSSRKEPSSQRRVGCASHCRIDLSPVRASRSRPIGGFSQRLSDLGQRQGAGRGYPKRTGVPSNLGMQVAIRHCPKDASSVCVLKLPVP